MQNILITGGTGYIGSHMVYTLVNQGYNPIVIDNLSNSSGKNLKTIGKLTGKKINFYRLDLRNKSELSKLNLEKIDAIIHFAAKKAVGESVEKPLEYYQNNIEGTLNLLEWAKVNNINNFIFSSTAAVYGLTEDKAVTEENAVSPESPYAWSKYMIEQILHDANKAYGLNSVIFRYFNLAGNIESGEIGEEAENPQNLLPALLMSHLGYRPMKLKVFGNDYPTRDGTGVRDYIHVLDLVDGHLKGLNYLDNHKGSHVFNLGTGKGTTVLEVISAFENVTGEKLSYEIAPRRPGDITFSTCDASKAKKELNWEPSRTLEDMISSMWKWYKYGYKS